ncbi:MAG: ChpI protein [Spirochaetales bacterium]|nr:ChpI protein [Spirochaetales bacterium]
MKTAISIPDNLFKQAECAARKLGLARSQLYVLAIREFIEHFDKERITEKLNALYSGENAMDESTINSGLESLRETTRNDSW